MPEPTTALTVVQQQRAEALRIAREVLEETTTAPAFTRPAKAAPMLEDLLATADYLLTGYRIEERDEHPTHAAIHNAGQGLYVEVTRQADGIAVHEQTEVPVPPTTDPEPPYLHAKELDDTRLCGSSDLGTVFWTSATCPQCKAIIAALSPKPEGGGAADPDPLSPEPAPPPEED